MLCVSSRHQWTESAPGESGRWPEPEGDNTTQVLQGACGPGPGHPQQGLKSTSRPAARSLCEQSEQGVRGLNVQDQHPTREGQAQNRARSCSRDLQWQVFTSPAHTRLCSGCQGRREPSNVPALTLVTFQSGGQAMAIEAMVPVGR